MRFASALLIVLLSLLAAMPCISEQDDIVRVLMSAGGITGYFSTSMNYEKAMDSLGILRSKLDEFQAMGIDGFILSCGWQFGFGGDQRWAPSPDMPLEGHEYQRMRVLNDSGLIEELNRRGMDSFLLCYLGGYWAKTPAADWFDDTGWANACEQMRQMCAVAKRLGCTGVGFDGEQYGVGKATWHWNYEGNTHSEKEVRSQARKRGSQFMQAILSGYPDAIVITYPDYNSTAKSWFNQRFREDVQAPFGLVWDDFIAGMASVEGDCFVPRNGFYIFSEIFYKTTHGLAPTWDEAVNTWTARIKEGFRQKFTNYDYWEKHGGIAYGAWLDGPRELTGKYAGPVPVERAEKQLAAFLKQGSPYVWIYREQSIDWDYSSYKELLRQISGYKE